MENNLQLTDHEIAIILVALNAKYEEFCEYESCAQRANDYLQVYEKILSQANNSGNK